jgi:hypothetical protein
VTRWAVRRLFMVKQVWSGAWQDDGGQTRYSTELHADTVAMLDGR